MARHSAVRLVLAIGSILALGWAITGWLVVPRPSNLLEELADLQQLAGRFDADRAYPRIVLLLSPT